MIYNNVNDFIMSKIVKLWKDYSFTFITDENLFKMQGEFRCAIDEAEKMFGESELINQYKGDSNFSISINDCIKISYNGIFKNGKPYLQDYKFKKLNDSFVEDLVVCLDLEKEFNKGADEILKDKPDTITEEWLYEVYLKLRVLLEKLQETCLYNKKILEEVKSYSYLIEGEDTKYYIKHDNVYKQELVKVFA